MNTPNKTVSEIFQEQEAINQLHTNMYGVTVKQIKILYWLFGLSLSSSIINLFLIFYTK